MSFEKEDVIREREERIFDCFRFLHHHVNVNIFSFPNKMLLSGITQKLKMIRFYSKAKKNNILRKVHQVKNTHTHARRKYFVRLGYNRFPSESSTILREKNMRTDLRMIE